MADDLGNRGPQDRARISTTEAHEVRYWTKELGVSKERLASVVARVGNSAEAARRELGRYGIRRESGSRRSVSSVTQPHEWLAQYTEETLREADQSKTEKTNKP